MGIRRRFMFIMGGISLVATLFIGVAGYKVGELHAIREAKNKGEIIFNYILSSRTYFKDQQQPLIMELVEKERFYPELMSGFVVARGTWEVFEQNLPGYRFKQASLDPLHPGNRADPREEEIIRLFRDRTELQYTEGTMNRMGERFFYMAMPIRVDSEGCLRCHGETYAAPKDQIEIYGTENGYHWQLGETVSAYVVYVSLEQALATAGRSALVLWVVGAGCLLLVMGILSWFLGRSVVSPLEELSRRTEELSRGQNIEQPVSLARRDEIGGLAQSVDRLRLSMNRLRQEVRK